MNRTTFAIATSFIALSACSFGNNTGEQTSSVVASSSESSVMEETKDVLYVGTLEKQGVSIFMEGTHRLNLEDGRFIVLESDTVNLNTYIGQKVEIVGAVRPTVEQGGLIMRVERVTSLEVSSSSTATDLIFCGGIAGFPCPDGMQCSDDPEDSCDPNNGGADCGGICVSVPSSAAASVITTSSTLSTVAISSVKVTPSSISLIPSVVSSTPTSSITPPSSSSIPTAISSVTSNWQGSTDLSAKAAVMAKNNMDAGNWTQQYCSSHIGYCIPVHKNWWFNAFGATSTTLWHLEIGPSEIINLGDGPLTVDVVSGNTSADGSVTVTGDSVVGIRSWTNGRHIEIRGPANLETAIRYITQQLKPKS